MKRRVVVTGLGIVTSLSHKVEDLWQRILRGESGIHALTLFDTERFKVKFGGEINDWAPGEDYLSAKEAKRIDRFTQFAMVAGIDAVRESGLDFSKEDRFAAASSSAPASAACTRSKSNCPTAAQRARPRLGLSRAQDDGQRRQRLPSRFTYGLRGPNTAVATACASAANAMGDAFHTIQHDDADVMITGGTEAAITPMGIAGFSKHAGPVGAERRSGKGQPPVR